MFLPRDTDCMYRLQCPHSRSPVRIDRLNQFEVVSLPRPHRFPWSGTQIRRRILSGQGQYDRLAARCISRDDFQVERMLASEPQGIVWILLDLLVVVLMCSRHLVQASLASKDLILEFSFAAYLVASKSLLKLLIS